MKMDGLIIVDNILSAIRNFFIDHFNKITSTFKYEFILCYLAYHSKGVLIAWKKDIQCITISAMTEQI